MGIVFPIIAVALGVGLAAVILHKVHLSRCSTKLEDICGKSQPLYLLQFQVLQYIKTNRSLQPIADILFPSKAKRSSTSKTLGNRNSASIPSVSQTEREPLLSSSSSDSSDSNLPTQRLLQSLSQSYRDWLRDTDIDSIIPSSGNRISSPIPSVDQNTSSYGSLNSPQSTAMSGTNSFDISGTVSRSQLTGTSDGAQQSLNTADIRSDASVLALQTLEKCHMSPSSPAFSKTFGVVCSAIELQMEMDNLKAHLLSLSSTPYDSNNPGHEAMLMELWNLLTENAELKARISSQWKMLGFQGKDPATDFRGTGILGLLNLLYFTRKHTALAREMMQCAHANDIRWFSFAIGGINITATCQDMLTKRTVDAFFLRYGITLETFHDFYSTMFVRLHTHWSEVRPENMLSFSPILKTVVEKAEELSQSGDLIRLYQ